MVGASIFLSIAFHGLLLYVILYFLSIVFSKTFTFPSFYPACVGGDPKLAAVVTLASSLDYTPSRSSLKLLLPLVSYIYCMNALDYTPSNFSYIFVI